ncbi:unnamed protein product [Arabidopsis lyrata]|uniref:Predicted protein n=1 Tax=Arabidopsis lyrata subsp. lyrata TaxID=81972 RepID=D7M859_ARALL|nr:predicted protein [Arabidopsis lyrata subsp. lyrata]CAH8271296.1 unnamed protein product [Arabidopsis lyrata]
MVSLAEVVSASVVGVASTKKETRRFLSCVVMAVSCCRDDEEGEGASLLL